jgi:hypothetical protein
MSKVIGKYADAVLRTDFRTSYTRWKFSKPKHNYFVRNRHSKEIILDNYDKYIIDHLSPGKTITYDGAGYYLDPAIDNLTVIELVPLVLSWYPKAVIDTGEDSVKHLYNQADNFIVNNTIRLRWKTFDEYTEYWQFQTRFFKPGTQIFFSFRDIFIFHNRLKHNFSILLQAWLLSMEQYGFKLLWVNYDLIKINDTLVDYTWLPEVDDMINGNVKIHWEYCP